MSTRSIPCWDPFDSSPGARVRSGRNFSPSVHFASSPVTQNEVMSSNATYDNQVPTPPQSNLGTPSEKFEDDSQSVSVSTAFMPTSFSDTCLADIVLMSCDLTAFYVNKAVLLCASQNQFNCFLSPLRTPDDTPDKALILPVRASVLNIVLHSVYGMSCTHYCPPLDDMIEAVHLLQTLGIPFEDCISPRAPLFSHLLSYAPLHPLEIYTLAASFELEELAKSASSHLISYPLYNISDAAASKVGPVFLKRLFLLHWRRTDELKRLILAPPLPHAETPECGFVEQKKLTRDWAVATAHLAWEVRPDTSTGVIDAALSPLNEDISCQLCSQNLLARIKTITVEWAMAKRTI